MGGPLWANIFYEEIDGHVVMHAMPIMLFVLCVLAIAYRYYSAFLAAKVAALDDSRPTPAHTLNDGQNYHPTNKWVLFGHHFAAISGAGPLIGPVLAIQYGYMPGLLWLVIGVCLAGAVQDMLVLAASVRRGGKSLAQIALTEVGKWPALIVSVAIIFIVIIALAGLGFVVVKALGGEEVRFGAGMHILLPPGGKLERDAAASTAAHDVFLFPEKCDLRYGDEGATVTRPEAFRVHVPAGDFIGFIEDGEVTERTWTGYLNRRAQLPPLAGVVLPQGSMQPVPGSSWGTFTIACTIPIAFLVSLWMYRIRKGRVVEASLIGAVGVLAATVAGSLIPGSPLESVFSLDKKETIWALCIYGFIASVLPVWLLLCPRDYISSFLKIGTIALLVLGVVLANPLLRCPPINEEFSGGGPTFPAGGIFPFVFICVMCGAISGFHSLVSSGTTPKMVDKESHIRPIGYGAMLIEGLVGVVALIAAAALDPRVYYDINVSQDAAVQQRWQPRLDRFYQEMSHLDRLEHLNLAQIEKQVGGESLRGRTGGAVTLAVGMSLILTKPLNQLGLPFDDVMKYWYHFAIMFEALFILTTIDTGTRIARFLLQETIGKVYPKFERTDWLPGAVAATAVVTAGWGLLVATGSIDTIWPMFGIANQLLAVIALCLVTTLLINTGRQRYALVTLLPMLFVTMTTMSAGVLMVRQFGRMMSQPEQVLTGILNLVLTLFVMVSVAALLFFAAVRWVGVLGGMVRPRGEGWAPSEPDALEVPPFDDAGPSPPSVKEGIQEKEPP
ncbi:MAG TPA: carbon starvation protein A [Gemmataceae bacterium]|nr:carbon starvation protein A [Gemmataceae bacterium]